MVTLLKKKSILMKLNSLDLKECYKCIFEQWDVLILGTSWIFWNSSIVGEVERMIGPFWNRINPSNSLLLHKKCGVSSLNLCWKVDSIRFNEKKTVWKWWLETLKLKCKSNKWGLNLGKCSKIHHDWILPAYKLA